ncbi:DUF2845 domain-containing protein [Frateuria defendens]|uniref:DUF2845 domain-containing protein n=1 Tax=Frateuria defendens TaxID=2219559 RepID=UPI00066FBC98|nr:DUF2845 domain-containing protein [Frateuria defendens]
MVRIRYLIPAAFALAASLAVHATDTLRVGSRVLVTGDSAARAEELLGRPSYKSRQGGGRHGRHRGGVVQGGAGERWQYRHGDHVITVTIVDGRVAGIEDHRR